MSAETYGKIKGYVKHEDIVEYIRTHYDSKAFAEYTGGCFGKHKDTALSEYITRGGVINDHSEDNEFAYNISGFIHFISRGEKRQLFYNYRNFRFPVDDYEPKCEAEREAFGCETTTISLGFWGDSVEIVKNIVTGFGGGWIDENDSDNKPFHYIEPSTLTADEIRS